MRGWSVLCVVVLFLQHNPRASGADRSAFEVEELDAAETGAQWEEPAQRNSSPPPGEGTRVHEGPSLQELRDRMDLLQEGHQAYVQRLTAMRRMAAQQAKIIAQDFVKGAFVHNVGDIALAWSCLSEDDGRRFHELTAQALMWHYCQAAGLHRDPRIRTMFYDLPRGALTGLTKLVTPAHRVLQGSLLVTATGYLLHYTGTAIGYTAGLALSMWPTTTTALAVYKPPVSPGEMEQGWLEWVTGASVTTTAIVSTYVVMPILMATLLPRQFNFDQGGRMDLVATLYCQLCVKPVPRSVGMRRQVIARHIGLKWLPALRTRNLWVPKQVNYASFTQVYDKGVRVLASVPLEASRDAGHRERD